MSLLAGFHDKGVRMKLFKVLFVFLLLGGDGPTDVGVKMGFKPRVTLGTLLNQLILE